jgi:pilus assembly protein Flp/PilA
VKNRDLQDRQFSKVKCYEELVTCRKVDSLDSTYFTSQSECNENFVMASFCIKAVQRLACDEDGPTTVEYAIMLALVIGVCLAAVQAMSIATRHSFDTSANALDGALRP